MSRVLVVEDEPHCGARSCSTSPVAGTRSRVPLPGARPWPWRPRPVPDVVVLDLGLPDVDGMTVLARLRRSRPTLPVVVLSARVGSESKIEALDLGAVDYVTKPFDVAELLARLRVAMRRSDVSRPVVQLGPVTVDLGARLVTRPGGDCGDPEPVHLTSTEWRMLETLLQRPGALVSGRELLTAMRGGPEHTENSYLRIYIQQLRRKLEVDPARPRHLITEQGMGYRFLP